MYEKTFRIRWDEELGRDWINIFNLELCLFTMNSIGGKAKDKVKVVEACISNNPEVCNECCNKFKCWTS